MSRFKVLLTLLICSFTLQISAQGGYKRYPTLEHFTNTWCSSCASRNPAMFTYLNGFSGQYHHMSIHPNTPYQGCPLYQHNTVDNLARKDFYGVAGTPVVFLNGKNVTTGAGILPASAFTPALSLTSPLGIQVTETTGNTRTATIKVYTSGTVPAANYVLHVAVLEKTLNFAAQNGETVHHNVLRKLLTPTAGAAFTPPADGQSVTLTYNYSMNAAWKPDEMYVMAYVQNTATKEVLNSGTRFDNFTVSSKEVETAIELQMSPNPAREQFTVRTKAQIEQLEVYNLTGQQIYLTSDVQGTTHEIPVNNWKSGVYLVRVRTREGNGTARIVVE